MSLATCLLSHGLLLGTRPRHFIGGEPCLCPCEHLKAVLLREQLLAALSKCCPSSMPTYLLSVLFSKSRKESKRPPMSSRSQETCIVNDAHGGRTDMCGRPAAEDRECTVPVCADHLCQHRRSEGDRCRSAPVRLDYGDLYARRGWFPDMRKSANCRRHQRYNCVQLMNGSVRCSGVRVSGADYCAAHAALLCRQKAEDGVSCAEIALAGSKYCAAHCWCEPLSLGTAEYRLSWLTWDVSA